MTGEAICKGSWALGTACGECRQCRDTAVEGARALQDEVKRLRSLPLPSSLSLVDAFVVRDAVMFGLGAVSTIEDNPALQSVRTAMNRALAKLDKVCRLPGEDA